MRATCPKNSGQPGTTTRSFRMVCEPELRAGVAALLRAEGFGFEPEPFSPWCQRFLAMPFAPGSSLAAFFGYIYIQDRSAMLPPLALAPLKNEALLDLCASPGGKSGFLAQLTGRGGFVLANEPNPARCATLRANLARANLLQTGVSSHPGEKLPLPPGSWSAILLDPPCSGWGTENKNPRVRQIWRGRGVDRLAALQRQLLRHAAMLLQPGGRLLYSTCTTNPRENQDQTAYAENELGLTRVPIEPFPGFVCDDGGEGCLLINGEASGAQGFYLSLLRKPGLMPEPPGPHSGAGAPPPDFSRREIPPGDCFAPELLPPGSTGQWRGLARFVPAASHLPANFVWTPQPLGRFREDSPFFTPEARLRVCLPRDRRQALVFEDIGDIRDILMGKGRQCGLRGNSAALWWRDLPLGCVTLKSGRIIAAFK